MGKLRQSGARLTRGRAGAGDDKIERRATDLQRFAPRDDPAAHGRARALGRVQTRDRGGAHDGGRHGS